MLLHVFYKAAVSVSVKRDSQWQCIHYTYTKRMWTPHTHMSCYKKLPSSGMAFLCIFERGWRDMPITLKSLNLDSGPKNSFTMLNCFSDVLFMKDSCIFNSSFDSGGMSCPSFSAIHSFCPMHATQTQIHSRMDLLSLLFTCYMTLHILSVRLIPWMIPWIITTVLHVWVSYALFIWLQQLQDQCYYHWRGELADDSWLTGAFPWLASCV